MRSPERERDLINVTSIARSFGGKVMVTALAEVSLKLRRGEYVAIMGPSGSGKSTLLNILGLLDRPSSGSYYLDGTNTLDLAERHRSILRGQKIGFVFQTFNLLPNRTAVSNVEIAHVYHRTPRSVRRQKSTEALELVGLGHRLTSFPPTLSGGERQRVAIARAISISPSLLLADEPTGNLDQDTATGVLDLFDRLHARGLTVVMVTHNPEVADRAERVVTLVDGRVVSDRVNAL